MYISVFLARLINDGIYFKITDHCYQIAAAKLIIHSLSRYHSLLQRHYKITLNKMM